MANGLTQEWDAGELSSGRALRSASESLSMSGHGRFLWAIALAQVLAFAPVWRWYAGRISDGSDEPWGLLALATLAAGFALTKPEPASRPRSLWAPVALTLTYAVLFPVLPELLRAALAMAALTCCVSVLRLGTAFHTAALGMSLLSLPVVASLQFYLGYPMRAVSGTLAVHLLNLGGFQVALEGTSLRWGAELVSIDVPCSGVRMLWTGLYLALLMSWFTGLTRSRTLLAAMFATALVVVGNGLRSAALFQIRGLPFAESGFFHEGVGVVVFFFCAAAIVFVCKYMGKSYVSAGLRGIIHPDVSAAQEFPRSGAGLTPHRRLDAWILAVACVVAGLAPLSSQVAEDVVHRAEPRWPLSFEGRKLQRVELSERERRFESGFPGRIAKFTDGERTLIFRWVTAATRKLHPASHCFRGVGYTVKSEPLRVAADSTLWGSFSCKRGDETLIVRERISDGSGSSWTDVSSWYWHAILGRTKGPWQSVTVVERPQASGSDPVKAHNGAGVTRNR